MTDYQASLAVTNVGFGAETKLKGPFESNEAVLLFRNAPVATMTQYLHYN
jgi:hypothetical protein